MRDEDRRRPMIDEITFELRTSNPTRWDVWVEFSFVQEGDHVGTLVGTLMKNACHGWTAFDLTGGGLGNFATADDAARKLAELSLGAEAATTAMVEQLSHVVADLRMQLDYHSHPLVVEAERACTTDGSDNGNRVLPGVPWDWVAQKPDFSTPTLG